LRYGDGTDE
jgi:L-lactate dehydrogenase (cytochrome)